MIYLSSSWKNRDRVRSLAIALRAAGHDVYDFTNPACRNVPEIPPERFPDNSLPTLESAPRLTIDAVEGGGVLVRVRPYSAGDVR